MKERQDSAVTAGHVLLILMLTYSVDMPQDMSGYQQPFNTEMRLAMITAFQLANMVFTGAGALEKVPETIKHAAA